jgi:hypothetical protein
MVHAVTPFSCKLILIFHAGNHRETAGGFWGMCARVGRWAIFFSYRGDQVQFLLNVIAIEQYHPSRIFFRSHQTLINPRLKLMGGNTELGYGFIDRVPAFGQ